MPGCLATAPCAAARRHANGDAKMNNKANPNRQKFKDMPLPQLVSHCQNEPDAQLAWAELYARFYAMVAAAAHHSVSCPAAAEDIMQEVYIRFFKRIADGVFFETPQEAEAYLWKIIACVKANYFAAKKRRAKVVCLDLAALEKGANAPRTTEAQESGNVVVVLEEYIARAECRLTPGAKEVLKTKLLAGPGFTPPQRTFAPEPASGSAKQKRYREMLRFKKFLAAEIRKDLEILTAEKKKDLSDRRAAAAQKSAMEEILRRLGGS